MLTFLAAVPFWILLTQGAGPSSSAINSVRTYRTEASCLRDEALLKKKFYVSTMCLQGNPED